MPQKKNFKRVTDWAWFCFYLNFDKVYCGCGIHRNEMVNNLSRCPCYEIVDDLDKYFTAGFYLGERRQVFD